LISSRNTNTVRWKRPRSLQNAEHWPVASVITESPPQGAGFDVIQHDGLRISLRNAIRQASYGSSTYLNLSSVASNIDVVHGEVNDHTDVRHSRRKHGPTSVIAIERISSTVIACLMAATAGLNRST
jgi:hypothetical protein